MSPCEHCRRPCGASADAANSETAARAVLADGINPPQAKPSEDSAARWGTAMHEAAHAVLAILAGGVIDYATIIPSEGYRGIVCWGQAKRPGYLETRIIISLAGEAAGDLAQKGIDPIVTPIRFTCEETSRAILTGLMKHKPHKTCENDFCEAVNYIIERRPDATLGSARGDLVRAQDAVCTILRDPGVWGAINGVARKLFGQSTCSDSEIRPIVAEHAPGADLLTLMRRHRLSLRL